MGRVDKTPKGGYQQVLGCVVLEIALLSLQIAAICRHENAAASFAHTL